MRGISVGGGRAGLSFPQVRRLEHEMRYRAQGMGLAVQDCRWEKTHLRIVAVMPPTLVRANIERALTAAFYALMKKEFPHAVLRGRKGRGIEDVGLPI